MKQETRESTQPLWMKIAFRLVILGLILCLGAMFVYPVIMISLPIDDILAAFRFLPSDEAMIENLHEHRKVFELLMRIYREDKTLYIVLKHKRPEVRQLMDRIGAKYMTSDDVPWPCADHDGRTGQHTFLRKSSKLQKSDAAFVGVKFDPSTIQQSHATELSICSNSCRHTSGIIFDEIHEPVLRLKTRTRVAKQYYYIPGIPKTEHGVLTGPSGFRCGPLRQSLNTYPPDFGCHNCVAYREIEPHWFIRLTQE